MSRKDIKPRSNAWRASVPYRKYAFHNVYNYTLMGGVGAAALLTQNWWLGVVGVGMEILWMVFAPDSPLLQRLWFDKVHDANLAAAAEAMRDEIMKNLSNRERERIEMLERKRADILGLAAQNQAMTQDLLRGELEKVDQLTASFLDLAALTHRQQEYLQSVDFKALEKDRRNYASMVEGSDDDQIRDLAQKNLAIVLKRQEKLEEINQMVIKATGQMALIENTFQLLADQIVTMQSAQELGTQLDELIDGVEAVKSTAAETQGLMEAAR